ncbi:MAG TPA: glycosyltransferase [Candidatus Thermoplasmatota archaeon]|nr:glycosyltransferase [Candidatus Thermoplasmatota archaeon]
MKVALLYGKNVFETGVRRYAEQLEEGLRRAGDDVERVEVARREWRIGKRRVGGFVSYWLARVRRAPRGRDVVHALDPSLALPGSDLVTVYDLVVEEYPDWYQRTLPLRVEAKLNRALARRVPWKVCISEVTRQGVLARWGGDPARVVVVPPNIDHARFRPVEGGSSLLAADRPNLVFTGANNPRKNLLLAVKAVHALREEHGVRARLLRIGPDKFPDVRREYEAYAQEHGVDLVEPGFVADDELAAILTAADAFLWPPVAEGFGLPPIEAMACGTPVVAVDTPINREVCGALATYHAADASDAARAIARALQAPPPRDKLRAHAAQFTQERMVRETRALYERILAERR